MEIQRNWIPARTFLLAACVIVFAAGCSSVPTVDTGERGLFQGGGSIARSREPRNFRIGSADQQAESGYVWPVKEAVVTSSFGDRLKRHRHHFHEGIDIRAKRGESIFAVKEGVVLYSSRRIKGYGNMVVVKHADGTATVYAHNKKNLVATGESVTRGQEIALAGSTGKSTGPHLHFEVRRGELPVDPLLYLPEQRSPAMARKETGRRLN